MLSKGKPSGDLHIQVEYQGPPVNLAGQNIQNQGQQQQFNPNPPYQGNQQGYQPNQQGNQQQAWGQPQQGNKPPQGTWGQPQPPKQDGPGFIM